MSIDLPPELDWVAELTVGQAWPKGDEDGLFELAGTWLTAAQQLTAAQHEIMPAAATVLNSLGGPIADQLHAFTQQLATITPLIADSSQGLAEMSRTTAAELAYTKYMLILQMIWVAAEIIWFFTFGFPELAAAAVTSGRLTCRQILDHLTSILAGAAVGTAIMTTADVAIQTYQILAGQRTSWNFADTVQNEVLGALGGGIAGAVNATKPIIEHALERLLPGIAKGIPTQLSTRFTAGVIIGLTTTYVSEGIYDTTDKSAAAYGAAAGVTGEIFSRGRHSHASSPTAPHTPHLIELPAPPDYATATGKAAADATGPADVSAFSDLSGREKTDSGGLRLPDVPADHARELGDGEPTPVRSNQQRDQGADAAHAPATEPSDTGVAGPDLSHMTTREQRPSTDSAGSSPEPRTEAADPGETARTERPAARDDNSPLIDRFAELDVPAAPIGLRGVAATPEVVRSTSASPAVHEEQRPSGHADADTHESAPARAGSESVRAAGPVHSSGATPEAVGNVPRNGQLEEPPANHPSESRPEGAPAGRPSADVLRPEGQGAHHDSSPLDRLNGLDAPTTPLPHHSLDDAPEAPQHAPLSPAAHVEQRLRDLERVSREADVPAFARHDLASEVRSAVRAGDWPAAARRLEDLHTHMEASVLRERLADFDAHQERGFGPLKDLGASADAWQQRVDTVSDARRSLDPDSIDVALREYTHFVERHVPAALLTGPDAAGLFHPHLGELRRDLAASHHPQETGRLREELARSLELARTQDRVHALAAASASPEEAALRQHVADAAAPSASARALSELDDFRDTVDLQRRVDALSSPTPADDPRPPERALRDRVDALREGGARERSLLRRMADSATPEESRRAEEELRSYREEAALAEVPERVRALRPRSDPDDEETNLTRRVEEAPSEGEAIRAWDRLADHRADRELRERLDRLPTLGVSEREQEAGLRARLDALRPPTDRQTARLLAVARGARTPEAGAAALRRLEDHQALVERVRQRRITTLRGRIAETSEARIRRWSDSSGGDTSPDLASRMAGLRRQLDEVLTDTERRAHLEAVLRTPLLRAQPAGRLNRLTDGARRAALAAGRSDAPEELSTNRSGRGPDDDGADDPGPGDVGAADVRPATVLQDPASRVGASAADVPPPASDRPRLETRNDGALTTEQAKRPPSEAASEPGPGAPPSVRELADFGAATRGAEAARTRSEDNGQARSDRESGSEGSGPAVPDRLAQSVRWKSAPSGSGEEITPGTDGLWRTRREEDGDEPTTAELPDVNVAARPAEEPAKTSDASPGDDVRHERQDDAASAAGSENPQRREVPGARDLSEQRQDAGPPPVRDALEAMPEGVINADPRIRSIGVPKGGLPHLDEVTGELGRWAAELGARVPPAMWSQLSQRLVANYSYLLPGEVPGRADGLLVPLGPVEALVSLDPHDPRRVAPLPASATRSGEITPGLEDVQAAATVNATYATGAHVQTESGATSSTRGAVGVTFGIGLPGPILPGAGVGTAVSGSANQSSRSTSHIADAERGHVEDNRGEATLLAYEPRWTVRLRSVGKGRTRDWDQIPGREIVAPTAEKLLLWVPDTYLGTAPRQSAGAGSGLSSRIPSTYFASGMSGLPSLFDGIARALRDGGLLLPANGPTRGELLQKLWNLSSHLDHAINTEEGFVIRLHDRYGRTVATVAVHSARVGPGEEPRVGDTSHTAHLENVRTSIDGVGGGHGLNQSSAWTPLNASLEMVPAHHSDVGVGLNLGLSVAWNHAEAIGSTRTGLWVMVPRYSGNTAAYLTTLSHHAVVTLRRDAADEERRTAPVRGTALLRLPEPDALEHGFPVDHTAVADEPASVTGIVTEPHRGDRAPSEAGQAPATPLLPRHLRDHMTYTGVGMGLVDVSEGTADRLFEGIAGELSRHGFLLPSQETQRNQIGGRSWWQLSTGLDSRVDNEDLLRKFLIDGLGVHHDQIHQEGLTLVLHRRRGFAGVEFDVDAARITIKARLSRPVEYLDTASDYHIVNLAMGMDSASAGTSGGHSVSMSLKAKGAGRLLGGTSGFGVSAGIGASDGAFYLNNRPELLEYSAGDFLRVLLVSTYEVGIELQHSGLSGRVLPGRRNPAPVVIENQEAIARVLPMGDGAQGYARGNADTPATTLDQAVIFHLDTTGIRDALGSMMRGLDGPQGRAARTLDSMTASLRAHMKEAANGALITDQPFDNGLMRDTLTAIDIRARLGRSDFLGASTKPFVQGVIKLWLSQATTATSASRGFTWYQADLAAGGSADSVNLSGDTSATRRWQYNEAQSSGQGAAKELIQLSFSPVYLYRSQADFTVSRLAEKFGKFVWSVRDAQSRDVTGKEMMYLLPEPEALRFYASDELPVSDEQLADAMARWQVEDGDRGADGDPTGPQHLALPGNTVAGLLTRWRSPDTESRVSLARLLQSRHAQGKATVWDEQVRRRFNEEFADEGISLDVRSNPLAALALPEYLTRQDPGGNILGHSNVISIDHEGDRSTADLFREAVDQAAPGLLTHEPDLWTGSGRHIGRLQGSVDTVLSLFGRGRDDAVYEDLLSANGVEFYLVNQVGWFLSDVVRVTLRAELLPGAEVLEERRDAGLENYGHHYANQSSTTSRDSAQAVTAGSLSSGTAHGSGGWSLTTGTGQHRAVTAAESGVSEQTVYSWGGLYEMRVGHRFTVTAVRVDMPHRPINELAVGVFRRLSSLDTPRTVVAEGVTRLHVPRETAEFRAVAGPAAPRDLRPLPKLPGDAYVTGVLLDDALPAARDLLRQVFDRGELPGLRGSVSLPVLLSRTHLTNVLGRLEPDTRVRLAAHIFQPGSSSHGVELHLRSRMHDLQVVGPIAGTGTGRYVKHQSGTTASAATDRWRANASGSGGGVTGFGPHTQDSFSLASSTTRLTSASQAAAGTVNYRREQHVKHQSPVYLVRVRVQAHLEVTEHQHHVFTAPTTLRHLTSRPINGEMYVKLQAHELATLRAHVGEAPAEQDAGAAVWQRLRRSVPVDLAPLLRRAAALPGADVARADLLLGRLLREEIGWTPRAVALTLNRDQLALDTYRRVVEWAVDMMARESTPGADATTALADYAWQVSRLPAEARPGTAGELAELTDKVVAEAHRFHGRSPRNPLGGPAELPAIVAFAALDPLFLARDVAHHLGAHVRVNFRESDGTRIRRWIDPKGVVHLSDPAVADAGPRLTSEQAAAGRLFAPGQRVIADALGMEPHDLGRVYRASWEQGRTFAQSLEAEFGDRRARLDARQPGLAELIASVTDQAAADPSVPRDPLVSGDAKRIEERLAAAGTGAASAVSVHGADGVVSRLHAVNTGSRVTWTLPAGEPTHAPGPDVERISSIDLDPYGNLLASDPHPERPGTLTHTVRFAKRSGDLSDPEVWWLDRLADRAAAVIGDRSAAGTLRSVTVTFTGEGDSSTRRRGRAVVTGAERAEAARRIWEERLRERLGMRHLTLNVPYQVRSRAAEPRSATSSRGKGSSNERLVTVDVQLSDLHPARWDTGPREVGSASFDVRRRPSGGEAATEVVVRLRLAGGGSGPALWERIGIAVNAAFNAPGHRLSNGDVLRVVVAPADAAEAHLLVDVTEAKMPATREQWPADITDTDIARAVGRQLGLRGGDFAGASRPQQPDDSGQAPFGLRRRHIQLIERHIGDDLVVDGPSVRREHRWLDPVRWQSPTSRQLPPQERAADRPVSVSRALPAIPEEVTAPPFLRHPETGEAFSFFPLTADRAVWFLERLDMLHRAPDAAEMDPGLASALPLGLNSVRGRFMPPGDGITSGGSPVGDGERTPLLAHTSWLRGGGTPEPGRADDGPASFLRGIADSVSSLGGRVDIVLWTDVRRDELVTPRTSRPSSDPRAADVRALERWAREAGVRVVNIDEVLSATHSFPEAAAIRALASSARWDPERITELLRALILSAFGGFHLEGVSTAHAFAEFLKAART